MLRSALQKGEWTAMANDTNSPEKLAKLAEEADHDAETMQDLECQRDLRVMALKYMRLAAFSRTNQGRDEGDEK
jgi:hypothetical protein